MAEENGIKCNSCGSVETRIILKDMFFKSTRHGKQDFYYQLLICCNCGMGFVDPMPTNDQIQEFYGQDYGCYVSGVGVSSYNINKLKLWLAKSRWSHIIHYSFGSWLLMILAWLVELITGRGVSYTLGVPLNLPVQAKILEIGYGNGGWLLMMKNLGYQNIEGYDIDRNSDHISNLEANGIKVSSGSFIHNHYPSESYDLVRLEHVFEHLPDPKAVLSKIRKLLKPGGILVMNFPTINSISFNISPANWAALELPRHLYFHTKQSVRNYLESTGLKIEGLEYLPIASIFGATINNSLLSKQIRIPQVVFQLVAPFYRLVSIFLKRGDFLSVIARKQNG